jgi:hypothetical protein
MPNPPINQLSFSDLRNMIKREARVSGATDLDDYINTLINELLLDYCLNNRYFEQLQLNVPVAIIDTTGTYALPIDFQTESLVRYQDAATGGTWTLYPRTGYLANPAPGRVGYYRISGAAINILPFDSVRVGDAILLDYYTFPQKLVDDADAFPIPKLIAAIKLRAVYRVHVYNNQVQSAQLLKGDATENELRSKKTG